MEENDIKLTIVALVCLLAMMIVVIPQTQQTNTFDVEMQQPSGDVLVTFSNGNISLPTSDLEDNEIYDILQKYDYDEWSYNEKLALTNMIARTARRHMLDDEFMLYISSMNRSDDIFGAYIDLVEHAGY